MISPSLALRRGMALDVGTIITAVVASLFGSGATATIVTAVAGRRKTRAEAADALTDSAIDLLNTVKADTRADLVAMRVEVAEARRENSEARQEVGVLRSALRTATHDAEALAAYLNRVVTAVHDPTMTIERLRLLVGNGPPANGSSRLSPPV